MSWLTLSDLWDGFLEFIDAHTTSLIDIHEEPLEREIRAGFDSQAEREAQNWGPGSEERVDSYGIRKGDRAYKSNKP